MEKLDFNITFATTTPESAEYGDFADCGFIAENTTFDDFSDLVQFLESNGFHHWSNSDNTGWLSTDFEIESYETAEEKQLSIHANDFRSQRYLELAYKFI